MAENVVPVDQYSEEPRIKCVGKILEIPVVNSMAECVNKVYIDIKNLNSLINFGLNLMEKGAVIVLNTASTVAKRRPISIPVNVIDDLVCIVLNEMKLKVPVVYSSPSQLADLGKHLLLGNFVAQKIFGALEYGCRFSEAILNIFPELSITEEPSDSSDENSPHRRTLELWKDQYYYVTKPIQYAKFSLRKLKKKLRFLRQTYRRRRAPKKGMTPDLVEKIKDRKKHSAKKHSPPKGFVEMITSAPKKAMELLGAVAHEYSKRNVDKETMIIDKTPSPSEEKSIDERRRKQHDDVESDDSDGLNLASLDDTYTSEDDPEYEIPSRSPTTDSLDYDSESVVGLDECSGSSQEPVIVENHVQFPAAGTPQQPPAETSQEPPVETREKPEEVHTETADEPQTPKQQDVTETVTAAEPLPASIDAAGNESSENMKEEQIVSVPSEQHNSSVFKEQHLEPETEKSNSNSDIQNTVNETKAPTQEPVNGHPENKMASPGKDQVGKKPKTSNKGSESGAKSPKQVSSPGQTKKNRKNSEGGHLPRPSAADSHVSTNEVNGI